MTSNTSKLYPKTYKPLSVGLVVFSMLGVIFSQSFFPLLAQATDGQAVNIALNIAKTARNLTAGENTFSDSVNASNNDRLRWQIQINNPGNTTLSNVFVRDVLPSFLYFINGTTKINGNFSGDGITVGGISLGSLYPGYSHTITFETTVGPVLDNNYILTNYAYARADQISEKNDSATVYVSQPGAANLNIKKSVRDLTSGQVLPSTYLIANAGDRLLFSLGISVPSGASAVSNVRLWDNLPAGLNYISGSSRVDGVYIGEGIVSSGLNLGTMYASQTKTVNFEALVSAIYSGYYDSRTLTNYAYVSGDGVPQRSASAQVFVGQTTAISNTPVTPSATLTKKVVNLTSPNGTDTDNGATAVNILEYTITLTNNGPGILNNIHLTDILPPYVTFQTVDNGGSYDNLTNQVTWYCGSLANGTSQSFSFRVTVQAVPSIGYIIKNIASASADNLPLINSNETHTTFVAGAVKGAAVKAVTGSDNFSRNLAVSVIGNFFTLGRIYNVSFS
ncbi:MAG: cell surface protein [Parcubacteria group bacterium LiPW_39]|nr:MAG: cell surface protein [Parcubacteria group bacterium LiPW_39]